MHPLMGNVLRATLVVTAALTLLAGCGASFGETEPSGAKERASDAEGGTAGEHPEPPNIVLIPTDDLALDDVSEDLLEHMPNLKSLMEDGTTFDNAFVTNSLCCPSRATILRDQYTHNHQILHNQPPLGGFEKFRFLDHEDSTMATWLQERGYRTAFFGKYMNGYSDAHVPPGWDEWYGVAGNFLSNDLNENGHIVRYDPDRYHLDDVLSDKAADYITRTSGADLPFFTADRPFLMWIGTKAPTSRPTLPPATRTPSPTSHCRKGPPSMRKTSPTSQAG